MLSARFAIRRKRLPLETNAAVTSEMTPRMAMQASRTVVATALGGGGGGGGEEGGSKQSGTGERGLRVRRPGTDAESGDPQDGEWGFAPHTDHERRCGFRQQPRCAAGHRAARTRRWRRAARGRRGLCSRDRAEIDPRLSRARAEIVQQTLPITPPYLHRNSSEPPRTPQICPC